MTWQTVKDNGINIQLPTGATDSLRVVFDPAGYDIAYVVPDQRDRGNSNAAMIAAAPELFDACVKLWEAVLDDCGDSDIPSNVLVAAFNCKLSAIKAAGGLGKESIFSVDWAAIRRREQARLRQRRFRQRKKTQGEATDGQ